MKTISPQYQIEVQKAIKNYRENGIHFERLSSCPVVKKYLTLKLLKENIPHAIINKGRGIVKFVTVTTICPHCKGTGRTI